jgi:hypothetical protein
MCECFENCVGLLAICVLVFIVFCMVCTVFFFCIVSFMYIYSYLFLLPPSENSIVVSNNNNMLSKQNLNLRFFSIIAAKRNSGCCKSKLDSV